VKTELTLYLEDDVDVLRCYLYKGIVEQSLSTHSCCSGENSRIWCPRSNDGDTMVSLLSQEHHFWSSARCQRQEEETCQLIVLSAFEHLSGLGIKVHTGEFVCFREVNTRLPFTSNFFGYEKGHFSINYLGILIHYQRLTHAECKHVEERLQK
jgi:hypothetical protein